MKNKMKIYKWHEACLDRDKKSLNREEDINQTIWKEEHLEIYQKINKPHLMSKLVT